MVETDDMNISSDELSGNNSMGNKAEDDGDESQGDENQSQNKMALEINYSEAQVMKQLSAVFELLKVEPIHDQ